jgi:hypothetical protein
VKVTLPLFHEALRLGSVNAESLPEAEPSSEGATHMRSARSIVRQASREMCAESSDSCEYLQAKALANETWNVQWHWSPNGLKLSSSFDHFLFNTIMGGLAANFATDDYQLDETGHGPGLSAAQEP